MNSSIVSMVMLSVTGIMIYVFNQYCGKRFSYTMFGKYNMIRYTIAGLFLFGGAALKLHAASHPGIDTVIYAFWLIGIAMILWICYINFSATNFVIGATVSILQLAVFSSLGVALLTTAIIVVPFVGIPYLLISTMRSIFGRKNNLKGVSR